MPIRTEGVTQVAVLASDAQQSVLAALSQGRRNSAVYSPYGYHIALPTGAQQAFNGEIPDPSTGHYLLGNGYRAYNPVLMRFNQPDSWSPFGAGGLNPYVYCLGNPINRRDPTGHMALGSLLGLMDAVPGVAGMAGQAPQSDEGGSSPLLWILIGLGLLAVGGIGGMLARQKQKRPRSPTRSEPSQTPPLDLSTPRPLDLSTGASGRSSPAPSGSLPPPYLSNILSIPSTPRPPGVTGDGQWLRGMITDRNHVAVSAMIDARGHRQFTLRTLNHELPHRELRRGGGDLRQFGLRDLWQLNERASQSPLRENDPRLRVFLEGIEPSIRMNTR